MEKSGFPEHLEIGKLGEKLARSYLEGKNFVFLEQNYLKKWGEIDLIMEKGGKTHFVEVKTVSHGTKEALQNAISHGTYRPEERVDRRKLVRLGRAIRTWLSENREEGDFQLDVMTVRVVPREKYAVVDVIEKVAVE